MATSARTAALAERRATTKYNLLAPKNSALSSIVKKNTTNELNAMVSRYNQGLIGNEEMKAFLEKAVANPSISGSDKIDLQESLADFDSRVQKDSLEARFKAAPENSIEQYQSAQALASYYNQRASSMVAGTPAHSQALQNASVWQAKSVDLQNSAQKLQRQNLRYSQEQQINTLPSNSSERASARADMYKALYDQAIADGDTTDANKYASYYNQELTRANELAVVESERQTKEGVQAEKQVINDFFGNLRNLYHDGQINEQQYLQALAEVQSRVDATNDYALINRFDTTVDQIQKAYEKGGAKRGTTAGGLPVVLKKTGGSGTGGSGSQTDWDQQDYQYAYGLRLYDKQYKSGEITGEQYAQLAGEMLSARRQQVGERIATIETEASVNPNKKITYNGKKTMVTNILDDLYAESDSVEGQVQAYESGNFSLVEVPPKDFTKGGDPTVRGKMNATYELVDTRNIPQGQYVLDDAGVYHKIEPKKQYLTPEQLNSVFMNQYNDPSGKSYYVKFDSSGNPYIETGEKQYTLYDLEGKNPPQVFDYGGEESVKSLNTMAKEASESAQKALEEKQLEATQTAQPVVQTQQPTKPPLIPQINEKVKSVVGPIVNKVLTAGTKSEPEALSPVTLPKSMESVNQQFTQPTTPTIDTGGATTPVKLSSNQIQTAPKLSLGTQSTPMQQVYKAQNIAPIKAPSLAPQVQYQQPTTQQARQQVFTSPIVQKATDTVKNLATKITSLFKRK